jgi:hypothetical protein
MAEITGCARVTGVVTADRKENGMTARVGQTAPDFTAPSYYKGSFTPVKLSDFAGKWILLCFYPGDFTFV